MNQSPISRRLLRAVISLLGLAILLGVLNVTAVAANPPPLHAPLTPPDVSEPPRTGAFTATLSERSPSSSIVRMKARVRYSAADATPEYDLADESFDIYVPLTYDPSRPCGLIVWVSPTNSGSPPPYWLPILDKHNLLWIGANNAGNERIGWYRFGLALDAAHNMKQRYNIDLDRTYISGMSGGGRVASRVGVVYADEFGGAYPIVGCDFYKRTPVPDQPNKIYLERYQAPVGRIMTRAMRENRYVLLTGSEDFNRDETQTIYEKGFLAEKFLHVTYLEVPGMAHALPNAEWFEKGIVALDAPLNERRAATAEQRAERQQTASAALARALTTFENDPAAGYAELLQVALRFDDTDAGREARERADAYAADPANNEALEIARRRDQAAQLLSLIDSYIAAGRPDLAREKLQQVIELVPGTDLAREAQRRLDDLDR